MSYDWHKSATGAGSRYRKSSGDDSILRTSVVDVGASGDNVRPVCIPGQETGTLIEISSDRWRHKTGVTRLSCSISCIM